MVSNFQTAASLEHIVLSIGHQRILPILLFVLLLIPINWSITGPGLHLPPLPIIGVEVVAAIGIFVGGYRTIAPQLCSLLGGFLVGVPAWIWDLMRESADDPLPLTSTAYAPGGIGFLIGASVGLIVWATFVKTVH